MSYSAIKSINGVFSVSSDAKRQTPFLMLVFSQVRKVFVRPVRQQMENS